MYIISKLLSITFEAQGGWWGIGWNTTRKIVHPQKNDNFSFVFLKGKKFFKYIVNLFGCINIIKYNQTIEIINYKFEINIEKIKL